MSQSLRILLFLRRIGPYHHARFEAASNSGLNLTVVETRPDSQEYEWEFQADGRYANRKMPLATDPEIGIRGEKLTRCIEELFEQHRPDVIVTTGWADPEYHAVVLKAIEIHVPRVIISDSRYEDEPRKVYKELIKRMILKSYSASLVAGSASKNYLIRLGFNSERIFQPWDVVDNDYFSKRVSDDEIDFYHRDFICVSRFIEKKNIETLLFAYEVYIKQGGKRRLRLLGSGFLETKFRQRVKDLEIEKWVSFEGFKQYDELPYFLQKAYCLILPSISDQWGLVVNEAMASGLPVLVSKECGCAVDLVDVGKNGYIFEPLAQNQITKFLLNMDQLTENMWEDMSEASKVKISEWNLNKFVFGLKAAVERAVQPEAAANGFSILHRLLSK